MKRKVLKYNDALDACCSTAEAAARAQVAFVIVFTSCWFCMLPAVARSGRASKCSTCITAGHSLLSSWQWLYVWEVALQAGMVCLVSRMKRNVLKYNDALDDCLLLNG
jgi:hypothetical protein